MGLVKQAMLEELDEIQSQSYECSGCSEMTQLDMDNFESLEELQKYARQLEKDFVLCQFCNSKFTDNT